jgi:hypothetical protein
MDLPYQLANLIPVTVLGIVSGVVAELIGCFAHEYQTGYLGVHSREDVLSFAVLMAFSLGVSMHAKCGKTQSWRDGTVTRRKEISKKIATRQRILLIASVVLGAILSGYLNVLGQCK